jgi:hypothetical protein
MTSSKCERAFVYSLCPDKWLSKRTLTGQHRIYGFYLAILYNYIVDCSDAKTMILHILAILLARDSLLLLLLLLLLPLFLCLVLSLCSTSSSLDPWDLHHLDFEQLS